MGSLMLRKYADKSSGTREVRLVDGERRLVNPASPGNDHEPWPLAGVEFVGEPPESVKIPQKYAVAASSEGWLELVNPTTVYRPAAPLNDPSATPPHVFIHVDKVIFHCMSGDVTYKVAKQPDKYADTPDADQDTKVTDDIYNSGNTRVDAYYELELEA